MRLELPVPVASVRAYFDISVLHGQQRVLIELKYKTRALTVTLNDESFALRNHGAQDLGRYDFWKDVERLESAVSAGYATHAFAVFLTNDSAYWKQLSDPAVGYAAFTTSEGQEGHGQMRWGDRAGPGTRKMRESNIHIRGTYPLSWLEYHTFPSPGYSQFRFLLLEVCIPEKQV